MGQIGKLEARVQSLVDDRLFVAFWDAVAHFNTSDLVLYFDTDRKIDPVSAFRRDKLNASPDIPRSLQEKICKPAKDAAVHLKDGEAAFWLIANFPHGEIICTAIITKMMAPGGTA